MCRQESYFAYLFGVKEPGFYGAIVSSWLFLFLSPSSFNGKLPWLVLLFFLSGMKMDCGSYLLFCKVYLKQIMLLFNFLDHCIVLSRIHASSL
jgi:hypothetical protein